MKAYWFIIAMIAIPLDYILWNLIFGLRYGTISIKQSIYDSKKQFREITARC